jgi:hypothetical protein
MPRLTNAGWSAARRNPVGRSGFIRFDSEGATIGDAHHDHHLVWTGRPKTRQTMPS